MGKKAKFQKGGALLLVFFLVGLSSLFGGEIKKWELKSESDFSKGKEFQNVVLNSKGELFIGQKYDSVKIEDEIGALAAISGKGGYYVGTCSGNIYKIENNKAEKVFSTKELVITSFARVGDNIFAATIPNGKIFKMEANGNWSEFAKLPCKYIWQILPGGEKVYLYAATGNEGKVFKVNADGTSSVVYESKTENILCMSQDNKNNIYLGTSRKGLLIKLENGKPKVLYNFDEAEVKSICISREGVVYAAVNSGASLPQPGIPKEGNPPPVVQLHKEGKDEKGNEKKGNEKDEVEKGKEILKKPMENLQKIQIIPPPTTPPPTPPKESCQTVGGGSSIWKFYGDKVENIQNFKECFITEIILKDKDIIVGTNDDGKVFSITGDGSSTSQLYDFAEKQVSAFVEEDGELKGILASDNAVLHIISSELPEKGVYVSDVMDAKYPTMWGSVNWNGDGKISIQFRSGNTSEPDDTWSNWSDEMECAKDEKMKIVSPIARFCQFKINFDGKSRVTSVAITYKNENQKPSIRDIVISESEMPVGGMPIPMSGGKGEMSIPTHTPIKSIQWVATDDDGDKLISRIFVKREGSENWIPISLPIEETHFRWDTSSIPDGNYIVKVEVSDEKTNPPSDVLKASREEKVIIDNTPPSINLGFDGAKIKGRAVDKVSGVSTLEYRVDGGDWVSIQPTDSLFDDKEENFEFELKGYTRGVHTVIVRGIDKRNNISSSGLEIEIK